MDYKLEAMCLAVSNVEAMRDFYANVFGIEFTAEAVEEHQIYTGRFGELELSLVPAALSGVTTGQNPTHYDVYIPDLEAGIALTEANGGKTNGRLGENEHERAIGVFDPDGNFMVFKQRKT